MSLRPFQQEFVGILNEFKGGRHPGIIISEVTPGSGKSLLPLLTADVIPTFADFIAWNVPRLALAEQAAKGFVDPGFTWANPRGHKINHSKNDHRPCKGTSGFVTTHQALQYDDAETVLAEFQRRRGILIIDECHHVRRGSKLADRLGQIADHAVLTILMSGRLTRGDRSPIFLVPLNPDGTVNYTNPGHRFVRYTRREAIIDGSKLKVEFAWGDGAAKYYDANCVKQEFNTFSDVRANHGMALMAALSTNYAIHLLDECLKAYSGYRRTRDSRAKCLIVCKDINQAHIMKRHVKEHWTDLRCGIAVYKDEGGESYTQASQDNIRRFKEHRGTSIDVLITVAMAYEGLDVPSITHGACLTHFRSWPWIEQMVDRASRVDRKSVVSIAQQRAYWWVPDDSQMRECASRIDAEQNDAAYINDIEPKPGGGGGGGGSEPDLGDVTPINGAMTSVRFTYNDGDQIRKLDPDEAEMISEAMTDAGIEGISPLQFKFAQEFYKSKQEQPRQPKQFQLADATPAEMIQRLRAELQRMCAKVDRHKGWDDGTMNGIVKKHFGISRGDMTEEQLLQAKRWILNNFHIRKDAS